MNKPTSKGVRDRRRSIKVLASGGALVAAGNLPRSWSKPVVEAVMLPAHARTSTGATGATFSGSQSIADATRYLGGEALVKVLNTLVPAAQAQTQSGAIIELAVTVGEDNAYDFVLKSTDMFACPDNSIGESSSFHTGTGSDGVATSVLGSDCSGGNVLANLTVQFNGDILQASGDIDCLFFDFPLQPGGIIPTPSPCVDCPGQEF